MIELFFASIYLLSVSQRQLEVNERSLIEREILLNAEKKELFATILKCIEDTQSLEIMEIRTAMEHWKIKQGNNLMTKADKFSEAETKDAIEIIVTEGWHTNVIKSGKD